MNHESLRAAYDELLNARAPRDRAGCPSAEALLALVERPGSDEERLATLDHVMGCDACHGDVALLRTAADAAREAAPGASPALSVGRGGGAAAAVRRPFRVRSWTTAVAAGLVIAVGLGVISRRTERPDTPVQGPVLRGGEPTITLLPTERTTDLTTVLRWRAVPGATRYRVEVFGPTGLTLTTAEVRDTVFVLRDPIDGDSPFRWMVTALRANGEELRSPAAPLAP